MRNKMLVLVGLLGALALALTPSKTAASQCMVNADCDSYCCAAWGYCPPYTDGGPLCQGGRCYC